MGLGGGKLQRDALSTRGRTGNLPISNRNLRWNPIIVTKEPVSYAKEVEEIKIVDNLLVFVVENDEGILEEYTSKNIYLLEKRYCATERKWKPISDQLKTWKTDVWNNNNCCIYGAECCEWYDAVEVYSVLAIAIASQLYGVNFFEAYSIVVDILSKQSIDNSVSLPSDKFPTDMNDIIEDPIIRFPISANLSQFRFSERVDSWKPSWQPNKREEGDDASLQIMHVKPLIEKEIRHNPSNVRYGFRWTNIAMTDHTVEETVAFMERIVEAHKEDN